MPDTTIVNIDAATKIAVWALGLLQLICGSFIVFVYRSIVREHERLQKQSDERNAALQEQDRAQTASHQAFMAAFTDCRLHHEQASIRADDLKRMDMVLSRMASKDDLAVLQKQLDTAFVKIDKMYDHLLGEEK